MSIVKSPSYPASYGGVVPSLAQVGDLGTRRSECGVGALMPWCGKLYVENYNSHKEASGRGTSLRRIHEDMTMEIVPETRGVDGTYTNRYVHYWTNQLVIGPHVIDKDHNIRTIDVLRPLRVCGTTSHMTDKDKVYVLTMEGELFELNMKTYACQQAFDLQKELGTQGEGMVHFKDCYCHYGKLVVVSNEYNEDDWKGERSQGRLAEWDGQKWTIVLKKPFIGLGGRGSFTDTIFANGWDQASAILNVWTKSTGRWQTYRLPKASHCFDHKWQTEWPRIREVEHERLLLDHHGMFYELSPWAYGGRIWGVRPISTHLWVHGDFCSWRGMLVLGADNASPSGADNPLCAEPQSGLWFGKTDDLWNFGKPAGWGGPWWETSVKAGEPSDPYLMTGFEHKCVHIKHDANAVVSFDIEVDFMGHGEYSKYLSLDVAANGYGYHVFPTGFSAHWVRVVPSAACTATAQLVYT